MIRTITKFSLVAGGAAFLLASAAAAQEPEPKQLGAFNDWAAYTVKTEAGTVCYIVSQPKDSEPKNVNRDPVFFLVTHRPADKVRNEVNTIIGYPFKENSTATVTIGDDTYELNFVEPMVTSDYIEGVTGVAKHDVAQPDAYPQDGYYRRATRSVTSATAVTLS
jgi:hypothetical protein